ncbi:MAG: type III pantothenate kinase [Bacteroidia bacterium]|jgi:type III pantothenate kinase
MNSTISKSTAMKLTGHCLQLDVGNSSAKWRLVRDAAVTARGIYHSGDLASRDGLYKVADELDAIWVSSVAGEQAEAELATTLAERWSTEPWFARTQARTLNLQNSYKDPARMGVDRWLAMLGAQQHESGRLCVVDVGSALTIDLVSATGEHEGGYIIPGPALMERALLLDTDRVRFVEDEAFELSPGRSTAAAVRHGIAVAQAGSVVMVLQRSLEERPALIYSGGAGELLMELVGQGGQYLPDLVFDGLEVMAAAR